MWTVRELHGQGSATDVDDELARAAVSFLRRDLRTIEPRKMWPVGAIEGNAGKIDPPNQLGMALCVYGDAGCGRDVQRGKDVDGAFSAELVGASARAIRDRWHPRPAPTWVTALPSGARPGIVAAFARALAGQLGLPYVETLSVLHGAAPQQAMQNSVQQARNVFDKLAIDGPAVRQARSCWSTTSSTRAGR